MAIAMDPLRLVIVVPRYWPQVGDSELFAARLAGELIRLGARPAILSSKWGAEWPDSIFVREVPVLRLRHAPRGGWNTVWHMIELSRWLRRHQSSYDAVYVIGLRLDSFVAVNALASSGLPVVLRCHDNGISGDCSWQQFTRFGDRIRRSCSAAKSIVAPSEAIKSELLTSGYDEAKIDVIPCGAEVAETRSADLRFRTRLSLADTNHDLTVAEYAPLAVCTSRLDDLATFREMLDAWRDIALRWPSARMWIVGDGPARDALYTYIHELELHYSVFIPGTFEDLSDIFLAADFFILPQPDSGRQLLLEAMGAGLPVVTLENNDRREIISDRVNGLLVPSNQTHAWSRALTYLCDNAASAAQMGIAARTTILEKFSSRRTAEKHLELFGRLLGR